MYFYVRLLLILFRVLPATSGKSDADEGPKFVQGGAWLELLDWLPALHVSRAVISI